MPCPLFTGSYTMTHLTMTVTSDMFVSNSDPKKALVLDCRAVHLFNTGHIRGAFNISLPTLLLRRLATDKITVESIFKCQKAKERLVSCLENNTDILIYDEFNGSVNERKTGSLLLVLLKALRSRGANVKCLQGELYTGRCP